MMGSRGVTRPMWAQRSCFLAYELLLHCTNHPPPPKTKSVMQKLMLFSIALLCLSAFGTTASAEPLNPEHVPADAKWVVHLDFESLSDSDFFAAIRQQKPQATKGIRDWIKKRYGINPPEDLYSATAFSRDYRIYTGTVILRADYDPAKAESSLTKAMNHRTTAWQGHTLHTVTLSKQKPQDDGPSGDEEMTVVLLDEDTIVFGSSVPNLKKTVKLLSGDGETLAGTDSTLLDDTASSAWMYGAAIDLQQLKEHPVAMPILSQHERIVWSFGERDGKIYEQADLVARSPEVAKLTKKVLDGIVAYETLWSEGSKPMAAVMKGVRVTQDGKKSGFHWQGDSETVIAALGDALDRLATWKPMLMSHQSKHATKKR